MAKSANDKNYTGMKLVCPCGFENTVKSKGEVKNRPLNVIRSGREHKLSVASILCGKCNEILYCYNPEEPEG